MPATINLSDPAPAPQGDCWTFADGVYTVDAYSCVTVTGGSRGGNCRVAAERHAKKVKITLCNVSIELPEGGDCPAIALCGEATVTLEGENTLKTRGKAACISGDGITLTGTGSLTVCSERGAINAGSLAVVSGTYDIRAERQGAAIRAKDLTIHGGALNVSYAGQSGVGIKCGDITVNGGSVTAAETSGDTYIASGIDCENITINGGSVTADGGKNPAIRGEQVIINGGSVTARSRGIASAIGSGSGGTVTINGGSVTATVPRVTKGENLMGASAIGAGTDAEIGGRLIMNGGELTASYLDSLRFRDDSSGKRQTISVPTDTAGVRGGRLIAGDKLVSDKPALVFPPPPSAYAAPAEADKTPPREREGYRVSDGFEMMRVKAGTFTMGATPEQEAAEGGPSCPAHQVTLTSDYYIGVYPVTQEQWVSVMGSNPSRHNKGGAYPVENVSWDNVRVFLDKLNQKTGKEYRLPTEAEWEYAARGGAGSLGFRFSGSNDLDEVAWHPKVKTGRPYAGEKGTRPVGLKACNELGLYDMTGNVCEWVDDLEGKYTPEPKTDPTGAKPAPDTRHQPSPAVSAANNAVTAGGVTVGGGKLTMEEYTKVSMELVAQINAASDNKDLDAVLRLTDELKNLPKRLSLSGAMAASVGQALEQRQRDKAEKDGAAEGRDIGGSRVYRGGSWNSGFESRFCVSYREGMDARRAEGTVGFRLAIS
ncbi:MAG: SUMF1/EgtB/PvdO family nonheme iron enzyme [Oscillospiraceae bacterium]|jgi:formylglycine-generating enzyme required for sulfatase activity|nr:SUMF1/EgtB/PvdO family nonheme iron enzyme [Oscillospiraceae bacterium]